jgi:transcriptional regulator with XRE-family HTH domain
MAEQQRGRRAIEVGPTGRAVAANISRLRERRGMTTRQLSGVLERAGRNIPASGITRMEKGERVVTADELAALAVAFGVSPSALLLPLTEKASDLVEVTGGGAVAASDAWAWANGDRPLRYTEGQEPTQQMEHQLFGVPQWTRAVVQGPATGKLTEEGAARANAFRESFRQEHGRLPDRNEVVSWLFGLTSEGRGDG